MNPDPRDLHGPQNAPTAFDMLKAEICSPIRNIAWIDTISIDFCDIT